MTHIETLKLALALNAWTHFGECRVTDGPIPTPAEVDAALRQAIEQAEQAQPVKVWDAEGYDALCQQLESWKARALKAEQAQPVAWRCWNNPKNADGSLGLMRVWLSDRPEGDGHEPLYTAHHPRQPLTDEQKYALIEKHLGLVKRRDATVIDQRTGRFTDAQRYFDLIDEAAHGIKGEA